MDSEKDIELRRMIDHCHYLSMRMRMFPKGHPNREKWEKELKIADKEVERMMKQSGML